MLKKILITTFVLSFLLVNNATVATAQVSGVSDYAQDAVESFIDRGIISAGTDFNGDQNATRAFFATILAKSIDLQPIYPETATFKDVPRSHESYGYIEALFAAGEITGDTEDGQPTYQFRPDEPLNRAEAATMIVNILDISYYYAPTPTFKDVHQTAWYYAPIETARKHSIIRGFKDENGNPTGKVGPSLTLIRQDAVVLARNGENPIEIKDESYVIFDEKDFSYYKDCQNNYSVNFRSFSDGISAHGRFSLHTNVTTQTAPKPFGAPGEITYVHLVLYRTDANSIAYDYFKGQVDSGNSINSINDKGSVLFKLGVLEDGKLKSTASFTDYYDPPSSEAILDAISTGETLDFAVTVPTFEGAGASEDFTFACEIRAIPTGLFDSIEDYL